MSNLVGCDQPTTGVVRAEGLELRTELIAEETKTISCGGDKFVELTLSTKQSESGFLGTVETDSGVTGSVHIVDVINNESSEASEETLSSRAMPMPVPLMLSGIWSFDAKHVGARDETETVDVQKGHWAIAYNGNSSFMEGFSYSKSHHLGYRFLINVTGDPQKMKVELVNLSHTFVKWNGIGKLSEDNSEIEFLFSHPDKDNSRPAPTSFDTEDLTQGYSSIRLKRITDAPEAKAVFTEPPRNY